MARKRGVPRLAPGELEMLQMVWQERAVTIHQAHQALGLPIGYTTVQTRLNRLVKKGILKKSSDRPAKYSAAVTPEEVTQQDLDLLLKRVSLGRVVPLVAQLIGSRQLSSAEIAELKQLIAQAERRQEKGGGV